MEYIVLNNGVTCPVTMVKGTPKIGTPKTKSSYRDIPVPENLRRYAIQLPAADQQYISFQGAPKNNRCNRSKIPFRYGSSTLNDPAHEKNLDE